MEDIVYPRLGGLILENYVKRIRSLSLIAVGVFLTALLLKYELEALHRDIKEIEPNVLVLGLLAASNKNGELESAASDFTEGLSLNWNEGDGYFVDIIRFLDPVPTYEFVGVFQLPNGEPIRYRRLVDESYIDESAASQFLVDQEKINMESYELSSPIDGTTYTLMLANGKPRHFAYGNYKTKEGWYLFDTETQLYKSTDNIVFDVNQVTEPWLGNSKHPVNAYLALRLKKDTHKVRLPIFNIHLDSRLAVFAIAGLMIYISILYLHTSLGLVAQTKLDCKEPWLLLPSNQSSRMTYRIASRITTWAGAFSLLVCLLLPFLSVAMLISIVDDTLTNSFLLVVVVVCFLSWLMSAIVILKWRWSLNNKGIQYSLP